MKTPLLVAGLCAVLWGTGLAWAADPKPATTSALPKRDLTVELRQVEDTDTSGYTASTQPSRPALVPQQVLVRNGQKASLRISQSLPLQWVQSVQSNNASLSVSGASANSSGGGVTNALIWMDAGQSITVTPRWPGGKQPVTVEVEVQTSSVEERNGSDLPGQSRSQLATTVTAPLGYWVVIASSGKTPVAGSYSSAPSRDVRRLLQIRVSAN